MGSGEPGMGRGIHSGAVREVVDCRIVDLARPCNHSRFDRWRRLGRVICSGFSLRCPVLVLTDKVLAFKLRYFRAKGDCGSGQLPAVNSRNYGLAVVLWAHTKAN